ncbi:MAG: hypothetical protein JNM36_00660 [Chitinophagales bacterium]|nr:hypothetical protein [Chitinophagales bacterium]
MCSQNHYVVLHKEIAGALSNGFSLNIPLLIMTVYHCPSCGAVLTHHHAYCVYCGGASKHDRSLSDSQQNELEAALSSWEKTLIANKQRYDTYAMIAFAGMAILWAVGTWRLRYMVSSVLFLVILSGLLGIVCFVIFGGFVQHYEQLSMRETFDTSLKKTIQDFLLLHDYSPQQLLATAAKELPDSSPLHQFLVEVN